VTHQLPRSGKPSRAHDRAQVVDCSCKVLIHNNIIELAAVAHFFARGVEALQDYLGRILAALFQPVAQQGERGRQDENVDGFRNQAAHLQRTLPVDFQQYVMAMGNLIELVGQQTRSYLDSTRLALGLQHGALRTTPVPR